MICWCVDADWIIPCAASLTTLSPGGICESKLEQSHVDREPGERSRGALHHWRQSSRHVLARDQPNVERRVRIQAGKDGVASLRGLEHQGLAARRHRREVREEGR